MLGNQLRTKRPHIVPKGCVRHLYRSRAHHAPCQFVQFVDFHFIAVDRCFHLLNMTAEVANLVQRVPCGHLQFHLSLHVWYFHGHAKQMLLGVSRETE